MIDRDSCSDVVGYFCNVVSERMYKSYLGKLAKRPVCSPGYKLVISQYTRGLS